MKLKDRPLLFSSTIALSLIGSSIAIIFFWGASASFNRLKIIIEEYANAQVLQKVNPLYFFLFGALYGLSLIGVLKMWNLQKAGYFFYVGAQLTILIIPMIWLGSNTFSSTNIIFTLLFIGIYTSFIKIFK